MMRPISIGLSVFLMGLLVLQGCSSGKKGDTKPDAFAFVDQTGVALGVEVESNEVVVAGIDRATAIKISGAASAQYSVNDGVYTAQQSTVKQGDRVTVKVTSALTFEQAVNATVSIGGVSDVFSVTTLAEDTTPEAFSFAAKTDVDFDSWQVSDPITVTGINSAAPISVSNGEYKIDDGEYTNGAGEVTEGAVVTVRVKSSIKAAMANTATLSIGGLEAGFTVTTGADVTPPEIAILFPPPASMTEGSTVFVRGTAVDVNGTVAEVSVNGVGATSEDGFATWSVTVPLAEGENTLTVTAADQADNSDASQSVAVRMDPASGAFPDNVNPTVAIAYSGDFGVIDGREVYLVPDTFGDRIMSIDMLSGARVVVSDNTDEVDNPYKYPRFLVWGPQNIVYISDELAIYELNLDTKVKRVLASEGDGSFYNSPRGLYLREVGGESRLYAADNRFIFWINLDSLEQTLLTSGDPVNLYPADSLAVEAEFRGLDVISELPNLLFATSAKSLYSINLETGERARIGTNFPDDLPADIKVIGTDRFLTVDPNDIAVRIFDSSIDESIIVSSQTIPDGVNAFVVPYGIDCEDNSGYCLVVDPGFNGILAMDRVSGNRVVFTKSVAEPL